jgi:hypothetical protein
MKYKKEKLFNKVYVLCLNDYPEKVYISKEKAEQERIKLMETAKEIEYWHIKEVEFKV